MRTLNHPLSQVALTGTLVCTRVEPRSLSLPVLTWPSAQSDVTDSVVNVENPVATAPGSDMPPLPGCQAWRDAAVYDDY